MNIISNRPVVYSNGDGGSKLGGFLKGITKRKEGGTKVGNLLRSVTKGKKEGATPEEAPEPIAQVLEQQRRAEEEQKKEESKGLSTGAWIGIGAGALFVVGIGVYLAVKK